MHDHPHVLREIRGAKPDFIHPVPDIDIIPPPGPEVLIEVSDLIQKELWNVEHIARAQIMEPASSIAFDELKALLQYSRTKMRVIARDDARAKPRKNIIEAPRHPQIPRALVNLDLPNERMLFPRNNLNRLPHRLLQISSPSVRHNQQLPNRMINAPNTLEEQIPPIDRWNSDIHSAYQCVRPLTPRNMGEKKKPACPVSISATANDKPAIIPAAQLSLLKCGAAILAAPTLKPPAQRTSITDDIHINTYSGTLPETPRSEYLRSSAICGSTFHGIAHGDFGGPNFRQQTFDNSHRIREKQSRSGIARPQKRCEVALARMARRTIGSGVAMRHQDKGQIPRVP